MSYNKRKTNEEFLKEVYCIHPNIIVKSKYNGAKNKVHCKCKIDGYEWDATANNLINGYGCPKCGNSLKKTNEDFIKELKKEQPNIIAKQQYINSKTKIKFYCKKCGYIWSAIPRTVIRNGCPKCHKKQRYTQESFILKMQTVNPDIEILGDYINNHTKIYCKCKIDGYEWDAVPYNLLSGSKCPKCQKLISKTTEEFKREVQLKNPTIKIIGEYNAMREKIKCECLLCGNQWETKAGNLLYNNTGCPQCKISKGELEIEKILKKFDINFKKQYRISDCKYKKTLPFDFAIFNQCNQLIALIEYDGKQHYEGWQCTNSTLKEVEESKAIIQIRDNIKTQYCKNKNIPLIRIPYWECSKIEKILKQNNIIE